MFQKKGLKRSNCVETCTTSTHRYREFLTIVVPILEARYLTLFPLARTEETEEFYLRKGFPGCIGSIDCFHVVVKTPKRCEALMHTGGKEGRTTMGVQICVAHNLYILQLSVSAGSFNDLNRLSESAVPRAFFEGRLGCKNYTINGQDFKLQYLLADAIYPKYVPKTYFTVCVVSSNPKPPGLHKMVTQGSLCRERVTPLRDRAGKEL